MRLTAREGTGNANPHSHNDIRCAEREWHGRCLAVRWENSIAWSLCVTEEAKNKEAADAAEPEESKGQCYILYVIRKDCPEFF